MPSVTMISQYWREQQQKQLNTTTATTTTSTIVSGYFNRTNSAIPIYIYNSAGALYENLIMIMLIMIIISFILCWTGVFCCFRNRILQNIRSFQVFLKTN